MALDFSGIPEHAERKDAVSVQLRTGTYYPFTGKELLRDGGRIYIDHGLLGRVDVTEAHDAWVAAQPQVHSVTFTWTEPPTNQETEQA
jgi:hypothetical protein